MIEEVKLGTICELYSAGDKPKMFSDVKTDKCSIPVYGNGRDNEGLVGFTDKASFKCPAVTIAARGSSCGTAFYRGNPYTPIVRLISLVPKHNVDAKYLYYQIVNRHFRGFGSGQPQITIPDIVDAVIHLETDLEIQKRIANVLFTIDTKIANNNAICADLEGMAKLLYDYWFVQFDFPHKNGKPYKSSGGKMVWNEALKREIPEGWEVRQLGEFISVIRGISYKPTDELKVADENSVFLLKSNNIQNGTINFEQPVILSKALASNEQWLTKNSIFITMSSGSKAHMGKTAIVYKDLPYVFGAFCAKIAIQENVRCFVSTYFRSEWFRVYIENVTAGTNINNISNEQLTEILLPIPKDEILKKFENSLIDAFDKLGELIEENQQLASLRDFLLPMLMNGQVKVGKTDA